MSKFHLKSWARKKKQMYCLKVIVDDDGKENKKLK